MKAQAPVLRERRGQRQRHGADAELQGVAVAHQCGDVGADARFDIARCGVGEIERGQFGLDADVDLGDMHAKAARKARQGRVEVRHAAPGARPQQGREVGRQPRLAPALRIGWCELREHDIEGRRIAQMACDARVVLRQQLGAAFGDAASQGLAHEPADLLCLGVQREVVDAVDAGELHASEGDAARALGVGAQFLAKQRRFVGHAGHPHLLPGGEGVDEPLHGDQLKLQSAEATRAASSAITPDDGHGADVLLRVPAQVVRQAAVEVFELARARAALQLQPDLVDHAQA